MAAAASVVAFCISRLADSVTAAPLIEMAQPDMRIWARLSMISQRSFIKDAGIPSGGKADCLLARMFASYVFERFVILRPLKDFRILDHKPDCDSAEI